MCACIDPSLKLRQYAKSMWYMNYVQCM
jgi:hypothetical protein